MRASTPILSLLLQLIIALASGYAVPPQILKLERAFPLNNNLHGIVDLSQLKARDQARHGRRLGSVVDFPVYGDDNHVGLYYTRLQLGTPPKEFNVQIDSGSDSLWLACNGCNGCPKKTRLNIPLSSYDPAQSSSSAFVLCADKKCSNAEQYSEISCDDDSGKCSYGFRYGDGSTTSGYYVQDLISLITVDNSSLFSNTSASIMFGCSTSLTGPPPTMAVDGILGFGQNSMSIVSQLASQGVAPRAFSHCLKGSDGGGGILVLGEVVEPNMVYSPLMPGGYHYNLNIESISVNQQVLPELFSSFDNSEGAIIDSGTTLVYIPEEIYNSFVNAISKAVAQFAPAVMNDGFVCYTITGSVNTIFPPVSLNFIGGASMHLKPEGYLLLRNQFGNSQLWCIGFQKSIGPGMTIIGDVALKNKVIVYDLDHQRIGWTDYDCSASLNVSTKTGQHQFVTARQISKGNPVRTAPYWLIASSILISLVQALFLTYPIAM